MNKVALVAPMAVLVALAAGCGGEDGGEAGQVAEPTRLVVSAAASMTEALDSCAAVFGESENVEVRLSLAGSDELAAQIRQGANVDAYAAASTRLPEELHREGLLREPVVFATNDLVLAVPGDSDIESIDDLAEGDVTLAIGSESVPIGTYTRETLAKLAPAQERAILSTVRSNEPDVKGIIGKLTQGAVDAGFAYATDVSATEGELRAIELPPTLDPRVAYGAGALVESENAETATRFVDGLVDGDCAEELRATGFGAPP